MWGAEVSTCLLIEWEQGDKWSPGAGLWERWAGVREIRPWGTAEMSWFTYTQAENSSFSSHLWASWMKASWMRLKAFISLPFKNKWWYFNSIILISPFPLSSQTLPCPTLLLGKSMPLFLSLVVFVVVLNTKLHPVQAVSCYLHDTFSEQTIWYWITNCCVLPWERPFPPPSASLSCL